jgi:hypothetical protein
MGETRRFVRDGGGWAGSSVESVWKDLRREPFCGRLWVEVGFHVEHSE